MVLVEAGPAEHREVARLAAITGQTWNNPCLAGNRLLVRNAEEAACYELPLVSQPVEAESANAAPAAAAEGVDAEPVPVEVAP